MSDKIIPFRYFNKNKTYCRHGQKRYDPRERIIECVDCGQAIDPFTAFVDVVNRWDSAKEGIKHREDELKRLESQKIHLKAAKEVERAWRSRSMVPTCPHCHDPIYPTDGFGGGAVSNDLAESMRKERDKQKTETAKFNEKRWKTK